MANEKEIMLPKGNGEWMAETLRQRAHFGGAATYPSRLFRYYPCDTKHSLDNLRDVIALQRMRLNAKSEFNDPYDSYSDWQKPDPTEDNRNYFYEMAIRRGRSEHDARAIASSAFEGDDFWQLFTDTVRGSVEKAGIACFAEDSLNFLMWSHYASQHRGVVIEFNSRADDDLPLKALPVRYGDEFPRFEFNPKEFNRQVFFSVLYKSAAWRYEMEWRLVEMPLAKQWWKIDGRLICSITFGSRVQDDFRDAVLKLVNERNNAGLSEIGIFKTRLSDNAFALERVPL
jgi:hypothetical protein